MAAAMKNLTFTVSRSYYVFMMKKKSSSHPPSGYGSHKAQARLVDAAAH